MQFGESGGTEYVDKRLFRELWMTVEVSAHLQTPESAQSSRSKTAPLTVSSRLSIRNPEKLRLRKSSSPEPYPQFGFEDEPPISTAPAKLGREKRKRVQTAGLQESRALGFLPESQDR
jgi:hypothetical protein